MATKVVTPENLDPEQFDINQDEKLIKIKFPEVNDPDLEVTDAFGEPLGRAFEPADDSNEVYEAGAAEEEPAGDEA